jgi:hypothetical protein
MMHMSFCFFLSFFLSFYFFIKKYHSNIETTRFSSLDGIVACVCVLFPNT